MMRHNPGKRLLLSLFLILALAFGSEAQTLADILARHDLASGYNNRLKVKTMTSIGSITQMGNTLPISIIQKRPNKYRFDVHLEEGRITQAYDGKAGWAFNPFSSTDTIALQGAELAQIRESADFDGILHSYKSKGYTINLVGKASAGLLQAWKIQIKKPTGETLSFYIDPVTYLVVKSEAVIMVNGMQYSAESTFGDFRKIGGMTLPFYIQTKNGAMVTEIRISTVRLNEEMEDFFFTCRRLTK
jgi:outer membrane lipoprotein-sorting protein